jgi:ATP-dependent Lon protease
MAVALVSALTGIPTRPEVAMTGEITLRGTVLPIGGLIEKAVAARRAGLKTIVIPAANEKDLEEIPEDVRADLEFVPIETMDQVLGVALQRPVAMPSPAPESPPPPDDSQPAHYTH